MNQLQSRPGQGNRQSKCISNFYKIQFSENIFKYAIFCDPDLPKTNPQYTNLLKAVHKLLQPLLPTKIILNDIIYSPNHLENVQPLETIELDNIPYEVKITPKGVLEKQGSECYQLIGRLFRLIQKQLRLQAIGRKCFDPKKGTNFERERLEVWPGYLTSVKPLGAKKDNILLNIDICYKVLRQDTMLQLLESLQNMPEGQKNSLVQGTTVLTMYNKRMYRIESVDFEKSPMITFAKQTGEVIKLSDYYQQRYGIQIKKEQQPLLVHKDRKTGNIIYLIPELCQLTGLTDQMRSNFQTMKTLATVTKPSAGKRQITRSCNFIRSEETTDFIKTLRSNQYSAKIMDNWKAKIMDEPVAFDSSIFDPGNVSVKNEQFNFVTAQQVDRKIQQEMYNQPKLEKWAIYYSDQDAFQLFSKTFQCNIAQYLFQQECMNTCKYITKPPRVVQVKSNNFRDWEEQFKMLDSSVNLVVLILSGPKKAAPLYNDLKKLLLQTYGVPSQVALASTLKGKGIMICAKTGGIPWTFTDFPFQSTPTMLIGIDVYHKTGKNANSVFAFCSTTDRFFSKYYSEVKVQGVGQEIGTQMEACCLNSLMDFKETCHIFPKTIIVFRDGVSDSQQVVIQTIEVAALQAAITKANSGSQIIFICINKDTNSKFYAKNQNYLNNCNPGTVIDHPDLCSWNEFYMISQKTNQGIAAPTHYSILHNDFANDASDDKTKQDIMNSIKILCYKMCFMYFNWTGCYNFFINFVFYNYLAIKVPAPCQYAHKLSNLVGDRWGQGFEIQKSFGKRKQLYFI